MDLFRKYICIRVGVQCQFLDNNMNIIDLFSEPKLENQYRF